MRGIFADAPTGRDGMDFLYDDECLGRVYLGGPGMPRQRIAEAPTRGMGGVKTCQFPYGGNGMDLLYADEC
jgi:hypothetical protein